MAVGYILVTIELFRVLSVSPNYLLLIHKEQQGNMSHDQPTELHNVVGSQRKGLTSTWNQRQANKVKYIFKNEPHFPSNLTMPSTR